MKRRKQYFYVSFLLVLLTMLVVVTGSMLSRQSSSTAHATLLAAGVALDLDHTNARRSSRHTQLAVDMDCALIVPPNPLSAQGLAAPFQLVATNPQNGPCHESNKQQAAFVQGAIIDPATGTISIYNPLVIDQGTQPAIAPQPPFGGQIPPGDVVALWFGSNGTTLTLQDAGGSLGQGQCVNGTNGSIFGQFAFCNAPAFFQAVDQAMQAGKLTPPSPGMAKDGQMCPTARDFSIVDQDQSDNVTTEYLVTASGQIAQQTAINVANLGSQIQANGSDERLLTLVDAAIGCTPWMAPDLADNGHLVPALPLNELQAAIWQGIPVALVPNADPMTLINGNPDLAKLNAYRVGVDQAPSAGAQSSSTHTYCQHLLEIAPGRLLADAPFTRQAPSADPAVANSLFTFLAQRFSATYGAAAPGLNCQARTGMPDPVTVQTDGNGVATDAAITVQATMSSPTLTMNTNGMNANPDCIINGTPLVGCTGTAMLGGQLCSLSFDQNTRKVTITCPATA